MIAKSTATLFIAGTVGFLSAATTLAQETAVPREDTLIFDMGKPAGDAGNFNMLRADAMRANGAHQALFEPLFILNFEAGQIEPWLGVTWSHNPAMDEWTVELRRDIAWSDGEQFDADDIIFTVETALAHPELDAPQAVTLRGQVKSAQKTDDFTVVFRLHEANPRFLLENFTVRDGSSFLIMPEHLWRDADPVTFRFENPVGTGPYLLASAGEGEVLYDRNDAWWGNKPDFQDLPEPLRLVWRATGSEQARIAALTTGAIDASTALSQTGFAAAQAAASGIIAWSDTAPAAWPGPCNLQLDFNTAKSPWSDAGLRRAVASLIDRKALAMAFDGEDGMPARTLWPDYGALEPYTLALDEAGLTHALTSDGTEGKKALEALGYGREAGGFYQKDGIALTLTIGTGQTPPARASGLIEALAGQLRSHGVDANPAAAGADADATVSTAACGSLADPYYAFSPYAGADGENAANWGGSDQAAFRDLVEELGQLPHRDQQTIALTISAATVLTQASPFVPLIQSPQFIAYSERHWFGWPTIANNFNHPAHEWGSAHQIIHNLQRNDF